MSENPNIVFLVVESTDGRTWRRGYQNGVFNNTNLKNLRKMEDLGGTSFYAHYSNAPVCCPSRATFWSGRHAHHIPHMHNNIKVGGAWNNYEGLPIGYNNRMDQVLQRNGYTTLQTGKYDWESGSHSLNVSLSAWTMYAQFPYNVNASGGWRDETDECRSEGIVEPGNTTIHPEDWETVKKTTAWIRNYKGEKPFFVYSGMNIVHPPYVTNEHYFNKINPDKIDVPAWPALDELHPCDLQSSMLKGCTPSYEEEEGFYSVDRRRRIRRIYLAMISEWDDMVGEYLKAVNDSGRWGNTVFIVTSDHGDQQMEHQQHYKMVPYDASASVPMIILDGRLSNRGNNIITSPTQLIDIYPTVMEYANVPPENIPNGLDGKSLVKLVETSSSSGRPDFIVSQFHGCNVAMSWFAIVQRVSCQGGQECLVKYIRWGTGKEVEDQLFDLTNDPDERINLVKNPAFSSTIKNLDENLKQVVNYTVVAEEVALYNKESLKSWISNNADWREKIHSKHLRWTPSWDAAGKNAAFRALEEWLNSEVNVVPCRATLEWPPRD